MNKNERQKKNQWTLLKNSNDKQNEPNEQKKNKKITLPNSCNLYPASWKIWKRKKIFKIKQNNGWTKTNENKRSERKKGKLPSQASAYIQLPAEIPKKKRNIKDQRRIRMNENKQNEWKIIRTIRKLPFQVSVVHVQHPERLKKEKLRCKDRMKKQTNKNEQK